LAAPASGLSLPDLQGFPPEVPRSCRYYERPTDAAIEKSWKSRDIEKDQTLTEQSVTTDGDIAMPV